MFVALPMPGVRDDARLLFFLLHIHIILLLLLLYLYIFIIVLLMGIFYFLLLLLYLLYQYWFAGSLSQIVVVHRYVLQYTVEDAMQKGRRVRSFFSGIYT